MELFEWGTGDRPGLVFSCSAGKTELPPFRDLPGRSEVHDPAQYAVVQYRNPGFFGRSLHWWIAIDGDEVAAGGLGAAPHQPDATIKIPYQGYLAARAGLMDWREAIASNGHVTGSTIVLLAAASVPRTLDPMDPDVARQAIVASELANASRGVDVQPPPQREDPHLLWPHLPPTDGVRILALDVDAPERLVLSAQWFAGLSSGAVESEIGAFRNTDDLPTDAVVQVARVGIDGRYSLRWEGRALTTPHLEALLQEQ